jgi:hypothetical protein
MIIRILWSKKIKCGPVKDYNGADIHQISSFFWISWSLSLLFKEILVKECWIKNRVVSENLVILKLIILQDPNSNKYGRFDKIQ